MKKYRILKKNIKVKSEFYFLGYYKNHEIKIEKDNLTWDEESYTYPRWYIVVTGPNGGVCYDGWWGDYLRNTTIDDAIEEALMGSKLIKVD